MWCENCNRETPLDTCEICGKSTISEIPQKIFWCSHCKSPVIKAVNSPDSDICPCCGNKIEYLSKDLRPVFPEERLLLELLIAKPSLCVKLVCDISSIFVSYFTFLNVTAFFSFFSKRGCGGKSFFFFLNHF